MKPIYWISAAALAVMATGCERSKPIPEQDGAAPGTQQGAVDAPDEEDWQAAIATLRALGDVDFMLEGQSEANLDAINAALPDLVSISWDGKTFNSETGATAFTGLRVTIAMEPEFGLVAEEAEAWGLNSDFVAARLRGEQLDESAKLFDRMVARNVSYFGAADAMNALFDGLEAQMENDSDVEIDFGVETFESKSAQMVLSGVALRPFEYVPVPDSFFTDIGVADDNDTPGEAADREQALAALRLAQHVAAVFRTLEIEDAAWYDTIVEFEMTQPDVDQSVSLSWDFYAYEDLVGFDLGRAVIVDAEQTQSMRVGADAPELEDAGYENGVGYRQVETTDYVSYRNLKLDTLAGYLVRSEFPSMDQRDLMSLGTWDMRGYSITLNDGDVLDIDRVRMDATDFAWLIPTDLNFEVEGAQIGMQAIGEFALSLFPNNPDDEEAAEFKANLDTAIGKLEEHGLADVPVNATAVMRWDPDSGESAFSFETQADGFGEGLIKADLTVLDYAGVQTAVESGAFETTFDDLWQEALVFKGARFFERDGGGYDKLFGYASDIGKLYPDQGWGAMIGNMDAQQMRNFLATGIRSAKRTVEQEFPPAGAWVESIAAYYATPGGSIDIRSEPTRPITIDYVEALEPDAPPEQIVEDFGISVTHTPE